MTQQTATKVFKQISQSDKRINLLVGGAGSSKSYSVAQWIIQKAYSEPNMRILVTRKTLPSLRITAYRLILDLLNQYNLPFRLNKSELVVTTPDNTEILFKSLDEPEKIKSAEFNYIWVEEATEITIDDYRQLNLRLRRPNDTVNQMYLSFNPISRLNWIYLELVDKPNPDIIVFKSTYRDNPFLSEEYIQQLLDLINQDENYYKIYTLGEWGILKDVIYSNYNIIDQLPGNPDEIIYGVDFGYNNPSTIVEIYIKDNEYYLRERLYMSKLTNNQLIEYMEKLILDKGNLIYADTAEPARIDEICKQGFICYPSDKEVKDGIDFVKRHRLHITGDSVNLIKEIGGYKYKENKDGMVLDEPVKFNDHLMDAMRYALYTHCGKREDSYFRIG